MDMFELRNLRVGEREMFDMKTQPWFIKIDSQEEFDLVQEWLIENYGSGLQCNWGGPTKKCGVTNWSRAVGRACINHVMWMGEGEKPDKYASEIKFNFRKVIDNVEFPDVKSEQELEIERLTEIINQAQETLNKMKGEKI